MKKLTTLISIVLILVFGFSLNVLAINTGTGNIVTDTGTITVTGVHGSDKFEVYKLIDTYYDSERNTISYQYSDTNKFATFMGDSSYSGITIDQFNRDVVRGSITNGSVVTPNIANKTTLDQIASDYAAYIKNNYVKGTTMTNNGQGTATATGLTAGSYLVLPTFSDSIYAVMVGNIEYTAGENNTWTLNNATIVAKVAQPSIVASFNDSTALTSKSFNINDAIVTYATYMLPNYPTNAKDKTYSIEIDYNDGNFENVSLSSVTLNKGTDDENTLTIDGNNLKIGTDIVGSYSITNNILSLEAADINSIMGKTIDIVSQANFVATVPTVKNPAPGSPIINFLVKYVTEPYKAAYAVSDNVVFGDINEDDLVNASDVDRLQQYLTDSTANALTSTQSRNADVNLDGKIDMSDKTILENYLAGEPGFSTLPSKYISSIGNSLYPYTSGLNIYLSESGNSSKKLSGATFGIYSDPHCTNLVATTSVSDSDGRATYKGLANGLYYVKETVVPSGYSLNSEVIEVTIGEGGTEDDDTVNYPGYYMATTVNATSIGLPFTGGIGTIIYTMLGLLVVVFAVLLISVSKNKKKNKLENV